MTLGAHILHMPWAQAQGRARDFLQLTKPRVVLLVLTTVLAGFYLGSQGGMDGFLLVRTLVGAALAAGGTVAVNQYLEREVDGRMKRTRLRPLPAGRMKPAEALDFGVTITVSGLLYLALMVNGLSALVTAATVVGYIFVYTPLKQKTSLCSVAGAIPGALPPVTGWVAARGELGLEAGVLFAILFLWQFPHSLSIAWIYRDDYAPGGYPPPSGRGARRQEHRAPGSEQLLGAHRRGHPAGAHRAFRVYLSDGGSCTRGGVPWLWDQPRSLQIGCGCTPPALRLADLSAGFARVHGPRQGSDLNEGTCVV